jgi:3D-(3,5/4)-trihydroxycyclohexane-1,2-dione acylhydrolase (decyclizing)
VQAEGYDYPEAFFRRRVWSIRRPQADRREIEQLVALLKSARTPLIIAGGGVRYSGAEDALAAFASTFGIPVSETQAGKGALPWDHPLNLGAIGVTGTSCANAAAARADLILGIGTRLQDFTTGSRALFAAPNCRLAQINIAPYDAGKHEAATVVAARS